jgi:predicted permease
MRKTPAWRRYLRFLGSDPARDVDDELEFHFAMRVRDLVHRGHSDAEARAQATREFGDVERIRKEMQEIGRERLERENRARWWSAVGQDLRLAVRTLRKSPGFAAVVLATLALGIGGTTAVFSVVEAVLLAPLPYEEPGQLVRIYQYNDGESNQLRHFLDGPHFKELRERASSFEGVAAFYTYRETGLDFAGGGMARRLRVLEVSSDYFPVLRVALSRGRGFTREDEVGLRHVILSHALWRRDFGGAPDIVGATVRMSAEAFTIVGIAPEGFEDPVVGPVDAWLPIDLARSGANMVDNHFLSAIGRLRNGVRMDQARGELASLNRALGERWPNVAEDTLIIVPLKEDLVGAARGTVQLILLAVGLVLLVACVNVANLSLVRSTGRSREFAIRSALGSGGARIARQLLVESIVLAALGGLLGLLVATVGVDVLVMLGSDAIPRLVDIGFNPRVLGFAALITLATGIACGVAPAVRFAGVEPTVVLREQLRSASGSRRLGRLRTTLATAQVALALMLLAGAGVLILSFHRIQQVDLGFRAANVLAFDVSLPSPRYDATRRAAFQEEMARRLETIPGVIAAGGTSRLPATGSQHSWPARVASGPRAGENVWIDAEQRIVSGRFFEALGIPVLAGRVFDASDDADAPPRAVVSAAVARSAFPDRPLADVVGQRIAPLGQEREIVGVVGDVALDARGTPSPTIYQAHSQYATNRNWLLSQVVAATVPPGSVLPAVRATIASLDPELVVYRAAPITEFVGRGVSRERFAFALMAAFGAVGLVLAALGLYGVLSYAVRQRTREIGIRIALGATAAHARALVLRQAALVVGMGVTVGLLGALALGRWLSSLVFETSPWDPRVLAATVLLLTTVAFVAAWLPARRAARVDPRTAILEE